MPQSATAASVPLAALPERADVQARHVTGRRRGGRVLDALLPGLLLALALAGPAPAALPCDLARVPAPVLSVGLGVSALLQAGAMPQGKPSKAEDAAAVSDTPRQRHSSARAFADIHESLRDFIRWGVVLRLIVGMLLAVGCAVVIAWHPRRATKADPLSDLEERKTLILLGLVGSVVSALVTAHATDGGNVMAGYLAFVIFGIGALMRFRTALDNPKLTGKAILVVVIGIACGLSEWALAIYVTAAVFLLIFWLDSHLAARVRITMGGKEPVDMEAARAQARELLAKHAVRVKSVSVDPVKRRIVLLTHIPAATDPVALGRALRDAVPSPRAATEVEVTIA